MKKLMLFSLVQFLCWHLSAQNHAALFRYPDVSATQIVFTYANDIWVVPREGGTAVKLSSPPGVEAFPKFSPDGASIAFTGDYDGNEDVYVMPAAGGVPLRLTSHGYPDRVVGWQPDGKAVLFASSRESGRQRFNQLFTIPAGGGPATRLPLAYGEFASYSPDGRQLAVTFRTQAFRNWKRYRGGWKADIHVFNLADSTSENITALDTDAGNEFPMWHGDQIFFLTDRGPEKRMNLWRYDLSTKTSQQVTHFTDYDIHFPSAGPQDIVFENGGNLYLYNFTSGQTRPVVITVVSDNNLLKPRLEKVDKYIQHVAISPDGNRALVEARGDLFTLPAEEGFIEDITQTSGVAERYPAWSPDGKSIAYWSDASGEYELWITPSGEYKPRKLTSYGPGFRYRLFWSPDSRKIAFIDKAMKIMIFDLASGTTREIDHAVHYFHGELENFSCDWSSDSRWLVYSHDLDNAHRAVFLYDFRDDKLHQVTSGFYNCTDPVFDAGGQYLFLLTNQSFSPDYSDIDNSFVYTNSTRVAAIALQKTTPSILRAKNDTVKIAGEDVTPAPRASGDRSKKKAGDTASPGLKVSPVVIDFDQMESRMEILPIAAGNYNHVGSLKGKLVYIKFPPHEDNEGKPSLKIYDLDKKEEKTILDNVRGYMLSADREKMLVGQNESFAIIKPAEGQKFDKPLRTGEMQMLVRPMEEWKQILTDAWRIERDYFYDPKMHGVNWDQVKQRYLAMLAGAGSRDELNYIIGEMIGELSSSHTYKGGGDLEQAKTGNVGYLGVDYAPDGNYYRIKKIIRGASWDAEARSPLDQPGVNIREGDYLLAVNGVPVTTEQEPYIAFQGLADKTCQLTYNSAPTFTGAHTVVVKTMADEERLRYLNWVENYRQRVSEETQGMVGYIYVPSTGIDGQNELIRQFNAQWNKKALIIDERFNSGGQIPDRFVELLNRKPLSYWAMRDGPSYPWPPYANFGPKVMLINGWSGSGGDAFPDYFRKAGLGPLIGNRTWGGLIGISGVPDLIDGGVITAPSFRMFNIDGTWFREGHGVDPDIVVDEDLGQMAKGTDPQLERAIVEIKKLLESKPFHVPPTPAYEDR